MNAVEVFFDTNVLLYLLSADAARANRAQEIIAHGGVISVQVLNEFAAVAVRKLAMTITETRDVLSTIRAVCGVMPLDIETHDLGMEVARRHHFSIYDSLIIAAAMRAGCTTLYSENFHHRQKIGRLTIRNPFLLPS